jgi:protoporphyrinogen oxidase
MGLGMASLYLPGCSTAPKRAGEDSGVDFKAFSPIDRSLGAIAPRTFSGDQPEATHDILWAKEKYVSAHGGYPEAEEKVPLVIVGGGISGLCSAYLLRDLKPVVLERAERFGGNSRGESWQGLDYSIGAAYFMEPDKGSAIESLLNELGVKRISRVKTAEDPIVWQGRRYYHFWEGVTAPTQAAQFTKLLAYFKDTFHSRNGLEFPEIPARTPEQRARLKSLDGRSFRQHLEELVGGKLHPHIQTALEHFCWSSFGASCGEVSAAAGLNFYVGEFGNLMVTQGGNAGVAEKLLEHIGKSVPAGNLRSRSIVFDVRVTGEGVNLTYCDGQGVVRAIQARAVILACPQFVAGRLLRDTEPERVSAISKLEYRAYLVANVLLNKPIRDDFYDLYLIGDGTVDVEHIAAAAEKQKATDVVFGTFAKVDPARTVLTLYRSMPFSGGHRQLLDDDACRRFRAEFEAQIYGEILGLVGAREADVADIRLARWGHPLPVAAPGLFSNGVLDAIQKPFREKVFFVDQDNWALPAFETSVEEALYWAPRVRSAIYSKH